LGLTTASHGLVRHRGHLGLTTASRALGLTTASHGLVRHRTAWCGIAGIGAHHGIALPSAVLCKQRDSWSLQVTVCVLVISYFPVVGSRARARVGALFVRSVCS
jgi:hypothetical protein